MNHTRSQSHSGRRHSDVAILRIPGGTHEDAPCDYIAGRASVLAVNDPAWLFDQRDRYPMGVDLDLPSALDRPGLRSQRCCQCVR